MSDFMSVFVLQLPSPADKLSKDFLLEGDNNYVNISTKDYPEHFWLQLINTQHTCLHIMQQDCLVNKMNPAVNKFFITL